MMMLLAPWLLLAPVILLLRRALWVQCGTVSDTTFAEVDTRLALSLLVLDDACRLASSAAAEGERAAATRVLRGTQAGTAVLVRDMRRELSTWGAATWVLDAAGDLAPLDHDTFELRGLRALARVGSWLGHGVPANLPRLRVRLFTLSLAWRVLEWSASRLHAPRTALAWPALAAFQLDLHSLAQATLDARAAVMQSARVPAPRWRLAT